MLFLIVGLGNPGKSYSEHRHNIGFRVVDGLAGHYRLSWEVKGRHKFAATFASGSLEDSRVLLVKPQTFMNLSGEAVAAVGSFYKVPVERIAVVHDDIDLALGRVQIKRGGGHGGHRGVQSVMEVLGDADFVRVRIGVNRPPEGQQASDYVLEAFSPEEAPVARQAVDRACEAVSLWIRDGLTMAMNRVNHWDSSSPNEEV
jgi:PTH1 family peptidyl-tRNA hydrolase